MLVVLAPVADARDWNNKTRLTVDEPIRIPGATLTPGEYVIRLADVDANRNVVQFLMDDETSVISTVIAIPNKRLEATGDTKFTFYEPPAGKAPAMRTWFYPGERYGQELVYPRFEARDIAKDSQRNVPSTGDENQTAMKKSKTAEDDFDPVLRTTVVIATTPDDKDVDTETAMGENEAKDRTEMASAAPAPAYGRSYYEPTQVAQDLPDTAGPAPLALLLGFSALAGALIVRKARKRRS